MKRFATTLTMLLLLITPGMVLAGEVILPNPFTDPKGKDPDPRVSTEEIITEHVLGNILKTGLGIIGSITLVIFAYGGYLWLTSGGASDKIKQGKETFIWAAVGLAIIFGSAILVQKIIDTLEKGG